MLVLDVNRAHSHLHAVRELYIDLPAEYFEGGMVGLLLRTLYGTRDPAHLWDNYTGEQISELGFEIGKSTPCVYIAKSHALADATGMT